MKKVITVICMSISIIVNAQSDSTKIKGIQLQAKMLFYIAPQIIDVNNDALFQVYQNLRPTFRVSNPPSGTTLVTIDSINTIDLVNLYGYTLNMPDGIGFGSNMKSQIAATRLTNSYFDRLCTALETYYATKQSDLISIGKRLLKGN